VFWFPISSITVKDYISSIHDNPNKVWLDVYPGIFNGSLLESYEVLVRDNKVESYRRDYPDAQTGFTGMHCRFTSGRGFS
jgi:hypothetical protein